MSASLVGSEMCIRDSTRVQREQRRIMGPSRGRGTDYEPVSGSLSTPVSYTHLTLPTICSV
eukprot:498006-Alexandrium_andersonii.AAC.1